MIYLVDEPLSKYAHSTFLKTVLEEHTSTEVVLMGMPTNMSLGDLYSLIEQISLRVTSADIVLCAWAIQGNHQMDQLFEELAEKCWVVVAAGNTNQSIDLYTPARACNVITVGALNKSLIKATHSGFSEKKELEWVIGTNYTVDGVTRSGTSLSAALYAAFLAEAIKWDDFSLIGKLNNDYTNKVKLINSR
jgi:hypothetical protein